MADERPTSFAELTIVLEVLPPDLADENPTWLAELTIETVPLPTAEHR
jgi:hypothetical protein